jgi:hypothetical protein
MNDEEKNSTAPSTEDQMTQVDNPDEVLPPLTLWQMIGSALSAAIGVQSSKNRERDFARGKASHFIIIGVGFTAIFVVLMALLVRFILSQVT